jgi:hypothetical protein
MPGQKIDDTVEFFNVVLGTKLSENERKGPRGVSQHAIGRGSPFDIGDFAPGDAGAKSCYQTFRPPTAVMRLPVAEIHAQFDSPSMTPSVIHHLSAERSRR